MLISKAFVFAALFMQVESLPSVPPSGSNWWQGIIYLVSLSVVGLIIRVGEKWIDRAQARTAAGGSLKKRLRELKDLLEEGDLTQQEYEAQKQLVLGLKKTPENTVTINEPTENA